MKRILARTLLEFDSEMMWNNLTGHFILVFDDGEMVVSDAATQLSHYTWYFHREFPRTPMLMKHHYTSILGLDDKAYSSNSHLKLFANVIFSVYDTYPDDPHATLDLLTLRAYQLGNMYYNETIRRLEAYVVGLDITDFTEILNHPEIKAAKAKMLPTHASIQEVYATVERVLKTDPALQWNSIARAAKSGLSNMGQILQCVAARGFGVDMNSQIFDKRPIMVGYAEGIVKFYDQIVDSRSAALALGSSERPLEETEYFSRRLQLVAETLQNLHRVDCGSQEYISWTVRPAIFDEDHLVRRDDLETLVGKYYLNDEGGFNVVKKSDTHLYGTAIRMRSVIRCAHPDPYGICQRCYGQTAESIPNFSNLGQVNTAEMTQKSGQSVLSIKHLLTSAAVMGIVLDSFERQFLRLNPERTEYLLQPALKPRGVHLKIGHEQGKNMVNIINAKDVDQINPMRVAELDEIALVTGLVEPYDAPIGFEVGIGNRLAHFTTPMIRYIRKHKWSHNQRGDYLINMDDWDYENPILSLPQRHQSMSDHAGQIAKIIESSMKEWGERITQKTPEEVLFELHEHVNSRLTVPLPVLEVILLTAMAISIEDNNYAMPKVGTPRVMSVMQQTMRNRSLSPYMAFEKQTEVLVDPHSYVHTNRLSHPFDYVMLPEQVSQYSEFPR